MAGPAVLQLDLAPPPESDQALDASEGPWSADPVYCLRHRSLSGRGLRVAVKAEHLGSGAGAHASRQLHASLSVPFGAPKGQTLILDRDGAQSGSASRYYGFDGSTHRLTAAAVPYIAPIVPGVDLRGCRVGWRVVHTYYDSFDIYRAALWRDWVCDPNAHTPHSIRWPLIPDDLASDAVLEVGYRPGRLHQFHFQAALACGQHAQGALSWCEPAVIHLRTPR